MIFTWVQLHKNEASPIMNEDVWILSDYKAGFLDNIVRKTKKLNSNLYTDQEFCYYSDYVFVLLLYSFHARGNVTQCHCQPNKWPLAEMADMPLVVCGPR
jgi:hypothetical protein